MTVHVQLSILLSDTSVNPCYKHFNWKRWQRGRMLCIFKASECGHEMDRPTCGTGWEKGVVYKHRIKQSLYSYFWYFFYFSFFVFSFLKKKTDCTELNLYAYSELSNSNSSVMAKKEKGRERGIHPRKKKKSLITNH